MSETYQQEELSEDDNDTIEFIISLLHYVKKLEAMVIELREEVNERTPNGEPVPYFELHSDVYENFFDYQTFIKYQKYIEMYFDIEEL